MKGLLFYILLLISTVNKAQKTDKVDGTITKKDLADQKTELTNEPHLKNILQLTYGGDNAEAYFAPNDQFVAFQSNNPKWGLQCDQIFIMDLKKAAKDSTYKPKLVSTGKGRTTCSYVMPNNKDVLYASTHLSGDSCPPSPPTGGKYLWAVYNSFDIFIANPNGKIIKQLTNSKGYDAEATISPKGDKIVFTSDRSGDLELWTMDVDGKNQKQITFGLGYDGGAFFSPDGKKLVFRASRPQAELEQKEYKELLSKGLVSPTNMEIYTCNVDGSDLKQITSLGKANWAPFYHPSGKKIIFSSNHHSKKGYDFQLFMINEDGTGLEQITNQSMFNAFPMFSYNGKKLIFSSNRLNGGTRDTNLFIADWED
ncbi:MAG: PD40 domain-containing protein [Bacteroidetes bacterium]|nr:PD40 domain-containing protein [Bacteroidota bacterium]MCA6443680.1 PD40 domain-containing protein [Bacteroidota bacterium]